MNKKYPFLSLRAMLSIWLKKNQHFLIFSMLLFFALLHQSCQKSNTEKLFRQLPSSSTQIGFANTITANDTFNVMEFQYIYNGGGVGVADFNNDGLTDIFFSANQASCRLYLNKGNLQFADVTQAAGVQTNRWCTGVSIADINQDGLPDIYVSVGNHHTLGKAQHCLLFIHQGMKEGVPVFKEMAAAYHLDEASYVSQSAFFDYDKDGDLDVYLLRNHLEKSNPSTVRPTINDGSYPSSDKLLRNDGNGAQGHPVFTDVSKQAGIVYEGYGLGVVVADINQDGWPDVYCSDDFISNDILYINNHDGTFRNEVSQSFSHHSFNGMGTDVADFNNDLRPDIVQVDMLPEDNARQKMLLGAPAFDRTEMSNEYYSKQYVRNALQINNGKLPTGELSFSEIGQMAGVAKTDWSWTSLFADFDNDGWKDLFITNGYRKDVTDLDFVVYTKDPGMFNASKKKPSKELANLIPEVKVPNYLYRNQHDLTFENVSEKWGINIPSYSNGAVYADLDNDGDLDLVVNNIDDPAFVFQNTLMENQAAKPPAEQCHYLRMKLNAKDVETIGANATLWCAGQAQYAELAVVRGYKSTVEPVLHFGVGNAAMVDSVRVQWPNGKAQTIKKIATNQVLTLDVKNANETVNYPHRIAALVFSPTSTHVDVPFRHRENHFFIDFKRQPVLPFMHSRNGFGIAVGDVNADGLEDFYAGNAYGGSGRFFMQTKTGNFLQKPLQEDTLHEDMGVLFFDADNDRDLDLYVVSGSNEKSASYSEFYQDRLYVNDGRGNFKWKPDALPALNKSGSCVAACDFDSDGDLDLFLGGRLTVAQYPTPPPSYVLRNDGQGKFEDATAQVAPELQKIGMVTSALWSDFDNDGFTDLMVAGEWMPITFFKNTQGKLALHNPLDGEKKQSGFWNSLVGGDFDNDGDMDYLVGNLGLNTRYKASEKEPIKIMAKDFNKDGLMDPFMGHYYLGECYPSSPRDAMIQQYIPFRGKFKTYKSYSTTTFDQLFNEEQKKDAYTAEINTLESMYIENKGNGTFVSMPLPPLAQTAPLFGMTVGDYDQDGNLDVVLSGNFYSMEANEGNCDALTGLFLKGTGTGNFVAVPSPESGLWIQGDAKGMAVLHRKDKLLLLSAINSEGLKANEALLPTESILIPAQARYAMVKLQNGKIRKQEFYYGSGYLSSSSQLVEKNNSILTIDFVPSNR